MGVWGVEVKCGCEGVGVTSEDTWECEGVLSTAVSKYTQCHMIRPPDTTTSEDVGV